MSAHPPVRERVGVAEGRFVIRTGKVDIGQRISTALARIAAHELGLDPDDIDVATVTTDGAPDEGITSGSNSVEQSGAALRLACATLRRAALARAADMLGIEVPDLRDGMIVAAGSNRTLRLADVAATLDPDLRIDPDAPLRVAEPPKTRPPRGMRAMVDGSFRFIHDIARPGMLHARTVRPPHRHARLEAIDAARVEALEATGITLYRNGSFLAVAGENEYATLRAAERLALACTWDTGSEDTGTGLEEGDIFDLLTTRPRLSLRVEGGVPTDAPLPEPLPDATHEARFERPYQLHGSLAPSAALAEYREGRLSVLTHSQGIHPLRESMAEALDLAVDAVTVTHAPGSGCYGHNGADDAAYEAALVAMAIPGRPVLLKWTRGDEHAWEPAAPAMVVDVAATLQGDRIVAWSQQTYSDTHRGRPRPGPDRAGPRRLAAAHLVEDPEEPFVATPNRGRHAGIHRNLDPVYAIDDTRLTRHLVRDLPLRSSAMRCLGGAMNTFAIESMMDGLAADAGIDPPTFRRAHLSDPRGRDVLDALHGHAMWREGKPGDGGGRGIAYGQYKNIMTRVAVMVDIGVDDAGRITPRRALIVADAGRVVDPEGLRAQLEGGFIQAASWCLHERAEYDRGGMVGRDWDGYPVIRFDDIPRIECMVLPRENDPPLGAGEAACGPALAAIANAVHDATGLRLRRLPFRPDAVISAALTE